MDWWVFFEGLVVFWRFFWDVWGLMVFFLVFWWGCLVHVFVCNERLVKTLIESGAYIGLRSRTGEIKIDLVHVYVCNDRLARAKPWEVIWYCSVHVFAMVGWELVHVWVGTDGSFADEALRGCKWYCVFEFCSDGSWLATPWGGVCGLSNACLSIQRRIELICGCPYRWWECSGQSRSCIRCIIWLDLQQRIVAMMPWGWCVWSDTFVFVATDTL